MLDHRYSAVYLGLGVGLGQSKKKLCWGFQSHKNLDKEGRDLFIFFEPRKVGIENFFLLEPNSRSHKILNSGEKFI